MRAAQITKKGATSYTISEVPRPRPSANQILLKVAACGYCHTDSLVPLGILDQAFPRTGGHEPVGVIEELGTAVEGFELGQRIMSILTFEPCGTCSECKQYDPRYCPQAKLLGLKGIDGGFADYCLVDPAYTVHIPEGLSFEQAAPLTCAGVTIYQAIKQADMSPGDVLGISGLGALGYLGVQIAKLRGLKVVAVDVRPQPLQAVTDLRKEFQPDLVIDASSTTAEDAVNSVSKLRDPSYQGGSGVDKCIVLAESQESVGYAIDVLRPHGVLLTVGGPIEMKLPLAALIFKDITVHGTLNGTRDDMAELAQLAVKHNVRSLVKPFKFEDVVGVFSAVGDAGWSGKAVITF